MKFKHDGRMYEFDENVLTVGEAKVLYKLTGLGMVELGDAMEKGNPFAFAGIIYLAKKRAGEVLRFEDLDDVNFSDIEFEEEELPEGVTPIDEGKTAKGKSSSTSGRTPRSE